MPQDTDSLLVFFLGAVVAGWFVVRLVVWGTGGGRTAWKVPAVVAALVIVSMLLVQLLPGVLTPALPDALVLFPPGVMVGALVGFVSAWRAAVRKRDRDDARKYRELVAQGDEATAPADAPSRTLPVGPEDLVFVQGGLREGVASGAVLHAVDVEPGTIIKDTHGVLRRRAEAIVPSLGYALAPHWRKVEFATRAEHEHARRRARALTIAWAVGGVLLMAGSVASTFVWSTHLWVPLLALGGLAVLWTLAYRASCVVSSHVLVPEAVTIEPGERP